MTKSVSIIIPTFNAQGLLKKNLPAVIAACNHWSQKNCQIVVVDDASTDNTVSLVKTHFPQIKLVKNKKNLRFARAINKGVAEASGGIVILLNNDVKPDKGFIKPLVNHFAQDSVFAVGCLEINQESAKKVLGGRGVGSFQRGFLVHRRAQDQTKSDTLWVAGGSGAFRKSIWNKLGGLDSIYRPAYEEDRDISYNAQKAGYKILFEPQSRVTHVHETSNLKAFGRRSINIMSYKNQILFVWKNISSPRLLTNHIFWLPYHLIITTIRSQGQFLLGFLKALSQIMEVLRSRNKIRKLWHLSDEQVLRQTA